MTGVGPWLGLTRVVPGDDLPEKVKGVEAEGGLELWPALPFVPLFDTRLNVLLVTVPARKRGGVNIASEGWELDIWIT